jgi:hypothetical protein
MQRGKYPPEKQTLVTLDGLDGLDGLDANVVFARPWVSMSRHLLALDIQADL